MLANAGYAVKPQLIPFPFLSKKSWVLFLREVVHAACGGFN